MNKNQSKLEVHDNYKKDEKKTTNFEHVNTDDVINKTYLDKKLKRIHGHFLYIEKDYHKFKLQYSKQSVEEILIQRALKMTIQKLYDNGLFDALPNADKVLKDFLFVTKCRDDSEEVNDVIQ